MPLFEDGYFSQYEKKQHRLIAAEIEQKSREELLGVDETELLEYLKDKYSLEQVEFNIEGATGTEREVTRSSPFGGRGKVVSVTYHVPFSGDDILLKVMPSTSEIINVDLSVKGGGDKFHA